MRIITGTARGRRLETLAGEDTRPTAQRVKEGLFSAIQFELEGRRVLDLFAGSGQLGLEALSRGAESCVFVDKNAAAAEVARRNLRHTGMDDRGQVLSRDAMTYLQGCGTFDLVFLDPPYASGLLIPALEAVAVHVSPGGLIVCETDAPDALPARAGAFAADRTYRYGKIFVRLYRVPSENEVIDG
ncbi:MAG: 16S rRNA (guanine(966)-N(2))-methyltransferase RsmD [Acutalibacteraceae bacterium]|jgi:16S rRNA (guanine966-N2)-methyltransferase